MYTEQLIKFKDDYNSPHCNIYMYFAHGEIHVYDKVAFHNVHKGHVFVAFGRTQRSAVSLLKPFLLTCNNLNLNMDKQLHPL